LDAIIAPMPGCLFKFVDWRGRSTMATSGEHAQARFDAQDVLDKHRLSDKDWDSLYRPVPKQQVEAEETFRPLDVAEQLLDSADLLLKAADQLLDLD